PYSPDFVKIAEAFGVRAERISRAEECEGTISRAVAANAPYLIHADVCRDYPNSGGKAYGWWDVPIPEYEAALRAAYERARSEETV
ncbi:MAG TPA: thiamine pyrophosphate-dependent enzyme, partial [Clostridia bacterium]|nr:thiamine pyrophosphate-dependent enzyme [Clostridia bacterium]